MDARGIGHIFIHHLGQTEGGGLRVQFQRVAQRRLYCGPRRILVQCDRAAGKVLAVELAKHQIGVGDRRAGAAAAIAGGAGL